jgi:hypothetical protein
MIDDEAALLIQYPFRIARARSMAAEGQREAFGGHARKVLAHLKLCGWEVHRPLPKAMHRT